MKAPYIKRSTYDKNNAKLVKATEQNKGLTWEITKLRTELALAERATREIVPRLVRINTHRDIEYSTYRVCVDLHGDMIERTFEHGGDQQMIEYAASMIGDAVKRKMIEFNFARCGR